MSFLFFPQQRDDTTLTTPTTPSKEAHNETTVMAMAKQPWTKHQSTITHFEPPPPISLLNQKNWNAYSA